MVFSIKKYKKQIVWIIAIGVVLTSIALGVHNATLYNPRHGFDGEAHVYYINYLFQKKSLPAPNWEIAGKYGETHQPPLYYLIGAGLMAISGTGKTAQYVNIFVLWMIIGMVGLGLWRVFKKRDQVLIGMLSLAALPMLNIFPAMISNELLNTFWIISAAVSCLFIISVKNNREFLLLIIWLTVSIVLGVWTKVSIVLIAPTVAITFILTFITKKINIKTMIIGALIMVFSVSLLSLPIVIRTQTVPNASNLINMVTKNKFILRSPDYYYRLDWIAKVDMYNTQYYSMLGGAWNSFWTDGHNAITPFVKFHKKSFVLWSLGFVLLPICLYGMRLVQKKDKKTWALLTVIGLTMIFIYIYNNLNNHYSAARLTYEMGIVVPYSFGIASAFLNKKLRAPIIILLLIQFVVMVSFYWILPWWHVTR